MTSDDIRTLAEFVAFLLLTPAMIYTGWRRYRTGTIPPNSVEFYRVVAYANIINALRGREGVRELTPQQVREAGFWYMVLGIIGFVGFALALASDGW